MKFHGSLKKSKWQGLSLMEQMANIGSEVSRTINWKSKCKDDAELSFIRAIELLDLTIGDPKNAVRLKEVTRTKELFADWYFGNKLYQTTEKEWRDYFMNFAIASRLDR